MATGPGKIELVVTGLAIGGEGVGRIDGEGVGRINGQGVSRINGQGVGRIGGESVSRIDGESVSRIDGESVSRIDGSDSDGGSSLRPAGRGRVVFVPGGLPGDRVLVSIIEDRGRFLRGRLERILDPSPDRRAPPCPIADRCGGCPWMALEDAAQARARQALVVETLARLGGVDRDRIEPIVVAPAPFGYRNRLRLRVEGDRIGFRARASHEVVDVPACLVAEPGLNRLLEAVRARLHPHLPLRAPLQVEISVRDDGAYQLAASGLEAPLLSDLEKPAEMARLSIHVDPRPLDDAGAPRLSFTQANHAQNRRMIEAVVAALEPRPSSRVLDLYAGAGNFSLPLAGQVRAVLGIEGNTDAVAQAAARAPERFRYVAQDALAAVRSLVRRGERFDRVVLDPPRAGALEVCRLLPQLRPDRLVYVSCDPATLARDLRVLTGAGLELERVTPFDLMPQTAHVECVAVLSGRETR